MKDEILQKVLESDAAAYPRYDVVDAAGATLHANVRLVLKNTKLQTGTPYNVASVLPAALATKLGLDATATPGDALDVVASVLSVDGIVKVSDSTAAAAIAGTDYASTDADNKVVAEQANSTIVSIAANTTLALTHAGKFLSVSNESALTITVPTNASVAFPVGTEIEILRYGSGAVTIADADGATIRSDGGKLAISEQYAAAALKKIATNEWVLLGALS